MAEVEVGWGLLQEEGTVWTEGKQYGVREGWFLRAKDTDLM